MEMNIWEHTNSWWKMFNTRLLRRASLRGFSLIELLVVVGIFAMISSVILANHNRFNSSVLLGSLAYNIALSIREAQVYGLSVKQFSSQFQVGYGVRFTTGAPSYSLFADVSQNGNPPNKKYDVTDSIVDTYSVGQGHVIQKFCGETSSQVQQCSDGSTAVTIDHLDIVFFRPEPDANISSSEPGYYSRAIIIVASPNLNTRTITIASTGQITVSGDQGTGG